MELEILDNQVHHLQKNESLSSEATLSIIEVRQFSSKPETPPPETPIGDIDDENEEEEQPSDEENVSYWNGLLLFTPPLVFALFASLACLIPRHNSILYPNYWYKHDLAYDWKPASDSC